MKARAANRRLAAALLYAASGLAVFPCWGTNGARCDCAKPDCASAGKHPFGKFAPQGFKNATTDADTIRSWFKTYPNANIAIATGASKLVVIDVDPKNGGDTTWARLVGELGAGIERTAQVITGSKGKHFYFKAPSGVPITNRSMLGKGVDVRAEGGYVVAPASRHVSGRSYEWSGSERKLLRSIAELPDALLNRLTASRQSSDSKVPAEFDLLAALEGVPEGSRNETLFKAASSFRGANTRSDVALKLLLEAAAKCTPPYPEADAVKIVERVYETYQPNANTPTMPTATSARLKFVLTPVADMLLEPEEKYRWLVENRLLQGGLSMLVAKPKVGKSTLARNLAIAAARGGLFLGSKCQKAKVLYFALEEKRDEVKWQLKQMGAQGEKGVLFHTGPAPFDGLLDQVRKLIIENIAELAIFDPTSRLMRVKDLNDYMQVSQALEPFIDLARETNCHIMLVHHMGKTDREGLDQVLGSTALSASVDTLLVMRRRPDQSRTIETIQRSGADLEKSTLAFDAETQTLTLQGLSNAVDAETTLTAIGGFLIRQADWVSTSEIIAGVTRSDALVGRALNAGVEEGVFERQGTGRRGSPFSYRLAMGKPLVLKPDANGAAPVREGPREGWEKKF